MLACEGCAFRLLCCCCPQGRCSPLWGSWMGLVRQSDRDMTVFHHAGAGGYYGVGAVEPSPLGSALCLP